ncbi:MAG: hypothetical protein MUC63_10910 [Planctomycetes bacterium]|nr:hypothetical protein [Planctomycetota bacterium]
MSRRRITGVWKRSARLNASKPHRKHSSGSPGARTIRGNSPCEADSTKSRSPCSVRVGRPVDGPGRWLSTNTTGVSVMPARPRNSVMRQKPPPEVPTMARAPAHAAPTATPAAASSSSACLTARPKRRPIRARYVRMLEEGVIG